MLLSEIPVDSFWIRQDQEPGLIQVSGHDEAANTVLYINVVSINDAYDYTKEQFSITPDDLNAIWMLSV